MTEYEYVVFIKDTSDKEKLKTLFDYCEPNKYDVENFYKFVLNMNIGAYVRITPTGKYVGWGRTETTLRDLMKSYNFKIFDSVDGLIEMVLSNRTGFKVGDKVTPHKYTNYTGEIKFICFGISKKFDIVPCAILGNGWTFELDELVKYTKTEFKVGDKVKVVRKVVEKEKGWNNTWVEEMDKAIGNIYEVTHVRELSGIRLSEISYWFPPSSLELVDVSIEDMVKYLDTVHNDYYQAIVDDYNEAKEKEQKQKRLTELKQKYSNVNATEYAEYQTLLETLGD